MDFRADCQFSGKIIMRNKTILITGATSGIGLEAAKILATRGANIIFFARTEEKARIAKDIIAKNATSNQVNYRLCDLSSMQSIQYCCRTELDDIDKIDVLINNAGVWQSKRKTSADGIELTFAVNYLAPFYLTSLLEKKLRAGKKARIVNVASRMHMGKINFDDIEFKNNYSGRHAYAQSKLALILYTRLLANKLSGSGISAFSVHPGFLSTSLARDSFKLLQFAFRKFGKSPKVGGEKLVYAAMAPELQEFSGEYLDGNKPGQASEYSADMTVAEKLWAVSELYCNL